MELNACIEIKSQFPNNNNNEHTHQDIAEKIANKLLLNHPMIRLKICFTNDMYEEALALCENRAYLNNLRQYSASERLMQNQVNGTYIPPSNIAGTQYILISNTQVKDGYSYYPTVTHEVRHAINHTEFALKFCSGSFEDVKYSHPYYIAFLVWDEFMARKTGHANYIMLLKEYLKLDPNFIIESFLNNKKGFLDTINEAKKKKMSLEELKRIAGILARFSVWKTNSLNIDASGLDEWSLNFLRLLDSYTSVFEINFVALKKEVEGILSAIMY